MVEVTYFTRDDLVRELEECLEGEGMTMEEFRAEGEAGTLTDGYLRDQWLWYKPFLFDGSRGGIGDENSLRSPSEHLIDPEFQASDAEVPEIRYFTRDDLVRELEECLEGEGMTMEEFRAEGEAGILTDGYLRDQWLWYKPFLFGNERTRA